ncbi:hypothetical protein [Allomuricauda sp. d1]|uniref:ATP-grasp domain-containing protein n=1 Tax=Allomuricauda sp. d1 TaxID=3136725 RepID=UPI0031CF69D7
MKKFDVVVLTDSRYVNPTSNEAYIENLLLEDRLVVESLQKVGLKTLRLSWDDPDFDWSETKYALFRTTWDYFDRFNEFSAWLKKTAKVTRFINSGTLIKWNIDKHYLLDLHAKGINIPTTLVVETGTKTTLLKSIQKAKKELDFNGEEFVLKPCVAGAARHTYKFHESDWQEHENVFQQLIVQEAMMLQEFQKNIVSKGEISMMVFGGTFTHAILKIAKPGDFRVQDDYGGTVHEYHPTEKEIRFAESVVKAAPELPIYARVDIFEDNNGKLALAELEIFEPELWFRFNPEAAAIMTKNIKNRYFS